MDNLTLRLDDGTAIICPASLDSITTYVILEQARWFEREWPFTKALMTPGAVVVDIGANAGLYSLPLARLVGPKGCVVAFEPSAEARSRLTLGKEANGVDWLDIVDAALSDREGFGSMADGDEHTELGRLFDRGGRKRSNFDP